MLEQLHDEHVKLTKEQIKNYEAYIRHLETTIRQTDNRIKKVILMLLDDSKDATNTAPRPFTEKEKEDLIKGGYVTKEQLNNTDL